MKNIIISTDNSCDMNKNDLKKMNISVCDIPYFIDDVEYGRDTGKNVTVKQFYELMKKGSITKTSLINEYQAEVYLEDLLKTGNDILHIGISSGLSGTYESFKKVAAKLNEKHTNKIYVVDTKCSSGGLAVYIQLVVEKLKTAKSIDAIIKYAEGLSENIAHYFTVEDLKYLARGGRISKASSFIGTVLNIKPIIYCNEKGSLAPLFKVISRKRRLLKLVEKFKERYNKQCKTLYICHSDCAQDAQFIASEIAKFEEIDTKIEDLDFVLGSHCGSGCIALFFTENIRKEWKLFT